MPKIDVPSLVQKLPQNVRDHLFSEELTDKRGEIFEQLNLSDEQAEKVRTLIWQIYAKELSLPEFLTVLEKEVGLGKEASKKLAVQIIGWDFLPVADFLGVDVARYLKEIGADPQIFMQYANSAEVARELAEQISARGALGASGADTSSDERLRRRLEDIILNRLNNVRDDLETKNVLTRGVKLGGLELDEAQATAILELIKVELESLTSKRIILKEEKQATIKAKPSPTILPLKEGEEKIIVPEQSANRRSVEGLRSPQSGIPFAGQAQPITVSAASPSVPPPPSPRPAPPRPNFVTPNLSGQAPPSAIPSNLPLVEEEEKQAEIKSKILVEAKPSPTSLPLQEGEDRGGGEVSPSPTVPPSTSRGRIEEGVKPGDILAPDEAGEVKAFASKTSKSQFNVDDIIKNSLTRIQEEAAIKFDDPLLVSRFTAAVSNRLKDIRDSVETKDLLRRVVNLGGVGLAQEAADKVIKILDNEFSRVHEDLRAAKETEIRAVTQKRQEASEMKKNEVEKKEKDDLESRFKKLFKKEKKAKLEKGKAEKVILVGLEPRVKREAEPRTETAPAVSGARASLEDVKYTPRLVGPLEELKNFTLDDLRKLSARPADASRRLLDKLDVLRGEAMEKKIAGIGAFKASPLWQSYVEVINKALQVGQSPKDIIAARLAADKGAINQDEFDAIIGLSANLRF